MQTLQQDSNRIATPTSLKAAKDLLASLNLPVPSPEIIQEIGSIEGERFKRALTVYANRDDGWQEAHFYLNNILYAVSTGAREALLALGFGSISMQTLIRIGHHEGGMFRKHLSNAKQNGAPDTDMNYLRRVLASYGAAPLNQKPQPQQQPQHTQNNAGTQPHRQANRNEADARTADQQERGNQGHRTGNTNAGQNTSRGEQTELDLPDADGGYLSRHIYGGKNAICLNATERRGGGDKTVLLQAAAAVGERSYDWKDKISIQLSHQEMMGMFWVLMGWTDFFEGKGHGPQNEKSFSIKRQANGQYPFFISVNMKDKPSRAVPVGSMDGERIAMMLFGQMMKNEPNMEAGTYMGVQKHFASLAKATS